MSIERNTHLLDWLNDGWTHCQHGTRGWCEGYLHNARDVIKAQDDELSRLREGNRKLHRRVQQAEAANQSSEAILEGWCKFLRNRANRQFENTLFHIALGDIMNSRARIERRALSEREGQE